MREHCFPHLHPEREHRMERHHRILEQHRDALAAHSSHRLCGQSEQFPIVKAHAARGDAPGRVDQAEDRETRHRLARARLPDQPENLPAIERERSAVHRAQDALARVELRHEVRNLEQFHRDSLGFSTSRNWSPTRLIERMVTRSAMPG